MHQPSASDLDDADAYVQGYIVWCAERDRKVRHAQNFHDYLGELKAVFFDKKTLPDNEALWAAKRRFCEQPDWQETAVATAAAALTDQLKVYVSFP